ncbi:MAG: hypothetical protein ACKO37_05460 [Vampirovibrionales bacterium]
MALEASLANTLQTFNHWHQSLDIALTGLEALLGQYPKHSLQDEQDLQTLTVWDAKFHQAFANYQQALLHRGESLQTLLAYHTVPEVYQALKKAQSQEAHHLHRQHMIQQWCKTHEQFLNNTETLYQVYEGSPTDAQDEHMTQEFEV